MQADKTVDSCFILPIKPHKIGNARDLFDNVMEKYRAEAGDQLKSVGIRRVLVFLQTLPEKGDFLVYFLQAADSLEKTYSKMFTADSKFSKYLAGQILDITGIDMTKEENLPKIERLADWCDTHKFREDKDAPVKMPWSYAIPVKSGKTAAMKEYIGRMVQSRSSDVDQMLREHDILRRITFLQHTPMGDFIVQHILTTHPLDELLMGMSSCDSKLCSEARKAVREYMACDFTEQKNVPNVNLLFKWDQKHGFEWADQVIAYTE